MSIGKFIFSRITMILSIVMILSIPALCMWPLFHVKSMEVSSITQDSIDYDGRNKYHNVFFECGNELKHETYTISSKREMLLYNKLRNDGIHMEESPILQLIYLILWVPTLICFFWCIIEGFFINDLYDSEKTKLAKFYTKVIKVILKFLEYDPEKVEDLKLTIDYNKRLSFITCFIKLVHSLQ